MQTIARGEEEVFIILPISHQQDYEVSNHLALCKASRPSEIPSLHVISMAVRCFGPGRQDPVAGRDLAFGARNPSDPDLRAKTSKGLPSILGGE